MLTVVLLLITVASQGLSQGLTITSSSGTLRRGHLNATRSEAFLIPTTVIVPIGRARRVLVSASANDRGVYRPGESWVYRRTMQSYWRSHANKRQYEEGKDVTERSHTTRTHDRRDNTCYAGNQSQSVAISCNRMQSVAINGQTAPWRCQSSKAIRANQSQETMRGNQRQPVAIGCNQRPSVVKQPSPPPSPPAMSVVDFALRLAGDVSSFTPSVRTEMKSAIAARVGVDSSDGDGHVGQRHRRAHPHAHGDGDLGAVGDGQRDEQSKQRYRHARGRHRFTGVSIAIEWPLAPPPEPLSVAKPGIADCTSSAIRSRRAQLYARCACRCD